MTPALAFFFSALLIRMRLHLTPRHFDFLATARPLYNRAWRLAGLPGLALGDDGRDCPPHRLGLVKSPDRIQLVPPVCACVGVCVGGVGYSGWGWVCGV